jgi:small subunit ribosomal protein S5
MFEVPMMGTTIPHTVIGQAGAGRVLLKPAAPGTGVIAGGAVRALIECAGIKDVLSKSLGSSNQINIVKAAVQGLQSLRRPRDIAQLRGREMVDIAPKPMLEAVGLPPRPGCWPRAPPRSKRSTATSPAARPARGGGRR